MDMEETLYDAKEALQAGTGDTATLKSAVKAAEESLATAKKDFRETYLTKYSFVDGNGALGVGRQILAQGDRSMAVGDYAKAISSDAIAYGGQTLANGTNSMAMGGSAHVGTEKDAFANSMAIGSHTNVQAGNAVALGAFSQVTGTNSLALGFGTQSSTDSNNITYNSVSGHDSTLIGSYGNIAGNNSILIGSSGNIANDRVVALGNNIHIAKADENDQVNNTSGSVFLGDHAGYVTDSKRARSLGKVDVVGSNEKMELTESLSSTKGALRDYTKDFIYIYMLERQDDGTQIGAPIAVRSDFAGGDSTVGVVSVGSTYEQKFKNIDEIREYHTKVGSLITVPVEVEVEVTKNGIKLGKQNQTRYFAADSTEDAINADDTLSKADKEKVWNAIKAKTSSSDSTYTVFETRRIQNVAPGLIGSNSTDAINGSQLFATNQMLGNLVGSLKKALGDNVTITPDGQIDPKGEDNTPFTLGWIAKAGFVKDSNGTVSYEVDKAEGETEEANKEKVNKLKSTGYVVDAAKTMTFKAGKNIGLVQKPGELSISTIDTPRFTSVELRGETKDVDGKKVTEVTKIDSSGMKVVTETSTPASDGSTTPTVTEKVSTTVGKDGVSTDGSVKVTNGKTGDDAKDLVTIDKGKDGPGTDKEYGKIGLDGKNGSNATITVDRGTSSLDDKKNIGGTYPKQDISENNPAKMDRITYTTKDKDDKDVITHEVATMDDGLFFSGDSADGEKNNVKNKFDRKLSQETKIIGGIDLGLTDSASAKERQEAIAAKLTDGNIGVISDGTDTLTVKLAKQLTGLDSTTYTSPTTKTDDGDDATSTMKVDGNGVRFVDNNGDTVNNTPTFTTDGITGGNKTITDVASGIGGEVKDSSHNNANTFLENVNKIGKKDGDQPAADAISENVVVNAKDLKNLVDTGFKLNTSGQGNAGASTVKIGETINVINGVNTKVSAIDDTVEGTHTFHIDVTGMPISYTDGEGNALTKIGDKYYKNTDITDGVPNKDAVAVDPEKVTDNIKVINKDGSTTNPGTISNVKSAIDGVVGNGAPNGSTINGEGGTNTFIDNVNRIGADTNGIDKNSVVTTGDLKNLADTPLFFSGDAADGKNGNVKNTFGRKLSEEAKIVGGVTTPANLTDNNIGVVSNGSDTLTIKLAKQLTGLDSATYTSPTTKTDDGDATSTMKVDGNGIRFVGDNNAVKTDAPSLTTDGITGGNKQITNVGSGLKDGDTTISISDLKDPNKVPPTSPVLNNAINVGDLKNIIDTGFKLNTSGQATKPGATTVKIGDTINIIDGANTKVSAIDDTVKGTHTFHIDVTGLPMTYTVSQTGDAGTSESVSKVGDTYQLADGTKLVKVGDKFYKPSQLVDPNADQPQVKPEEENKDWTVNDSISLVNKDGSNNAPTTLKNVGSGLKDANGNSTTLDQAVGSNAVNVDDLRTIGKAATTEVTGTGAAEVTKVTGADGQNIYNVHVDKLMTVKPVDANTNIARGGDGKYYNAGDIAGKTFVSDGNGGGSWYNASDVDAKTGKPLTDKTPLDDQPIALDQSKLKNSVVNPNGDDATIVDNVKSGIGGKVKDTSGKNTFIDNINKVGKKSDDGTAAPDAISENTVVNAGDLKNLADTPLFFQGDVSSATGTNNTFSRKLSEKVSIVGEVKDGLENEDATAEEKAEAIRAKLSDGNIGVVSNGTDTLTIKLAKNLVNLTSVETGSGNNKTKMTENGITTTVKDGDTFKVTTTTPNGLATTEVKLDSDDKPTGESTTTMVTTDGVTITTQTPKNGDKPASTTETKLSKDGLATDGTIKVTGDNAKDLVTIAKGTETNPNATDKEFGTVAIDGKNGSNATLTVDRGASSLDDTKNIGGTDPKQDISKDNPAKMDRITYTTKGKDDKDVITHEVATMDDGFFLTTSTDVAKGKAAAGVKLNHTIKFTDGANTKVSTVDSEKGIHELHVDVTGLPMTYTVSQTGGTDAPVSVSKVGDTYQLADGTKLVKVGNKFYKPSQLVNPNADQPQVKSEEVDKNWTVNDSISLVNKDGSNNAPTTLKNVGSGLKDANGNATTLDQAVGSNAVNVDDLRTMGKAATTEVTGTGAAEVTKVTGADGQNIYNVHVDKLMTVKPVDANTTIARGGDGKYYDAKDIAGKTFVSDGHGGGNWYDANDVDQATGKPKTEDDGITPKQPLADQPQAVKQNMLKNSVVNPNGNGPTIVDNVKSVLDGSGIGNGADMSSKIDTIENGKPVDTAGSNQFIKDLTGLNPTTDADKLNSVSTVSDLQKVALTPLFFEGDTAESAATKNAFGRKLSEKAKIVGGQKDVTKLTDNNIGVVSNGSDTLTVKLAKELQGLTSLTTIDETDGTKTIVSGKGVTTNGKVVVNNGKTGDEAKELVTIDKGTDGSGTDKEYGKIGLDGKNGSNATITIDRGTKSLNDDVNIGVDPSQPVSETNESTAMDRITYTTTGPNNTVINHEVATLDDGFFLTTSTDVAKGKAAAGVKLNHTIKFTDGANTKVSDITSDNGVHEFHIDVTGLPMTYTVSQTGNASTSESVSKVGDTYQLADGTKLVKVGDKFYKPSQLVDPKADQPQVRPKEVDKNWTVNDSISLVNKDGSNNAPTLKNVGSGLKDAAGNSTSIDQAVGSNAVNVDDLRTLGKAATTEVTGTGAAEVTKVTGANGQNIYNVHVERFMQVAETDVEGNKVVKAADNHYYKEADIKDKTYIDGQWYNNTDIKDKTKIGDKWYSNTEITDGKANPGATELPVQATTAPNKAVGLQNNLVNPNDNTPTRLSNLASALSGEVGNGANPADNSAINGIDKNGKPTSESGNNTFVKNVLDLDATVKTEEQLKTSLEHDPSEDEVKAEKARAEKDKALLNSAVTVADLQKTLQSPLFFEGDSADGVANENGSDKNTFARKLSQKTKIVGGVDLGLKENATAEDRKKAITEKLTDHNIGVISNGTDTLTIKLAKDLTDLHSVTTTDDKGNTTQINGKGLATTADDGKGNIKITTVTSDGITIVTTDKDGNNSVSLTNKGLDNGHHQIINVKSGLLDRQGKPVTLKEAPGDILNNAVNVKDLRDVVHGLTDSGKGGGFGLTGNNGEVRKSLGETITLKGGIANKLENGIDMNKPEKATTDKNTYIDVKTSENGSEKIMVVEIAKDLTDLNSAEFTDQEGNTTKMKGDGIYIDKNGDGNADISLTSEGLNNGGNKITNVADGTEDTDAVNVSQLNKLKQEIKQNIGDEINELNAYAPVVYLDKDGNRVYKNGHDFFYKDGKKVKEGDKKYIRLSLVNADGKTTTPSTLQNVAKGVNKTDAVNVEQLEEATEKPLTFNGDTGSSSAKLGETVAIKGGANSADLTDNNIGVIADSTTKTLNVKLSKKLKGLESAEFVDNNGNTTNITGDGVHISGGNGSNVSLTSQGLNNGGNRITNVAPGVEATDAVNVSQLNQVGAALHNRINNVAKGAYGGVASAGAMASLPQAYLPGKSMVAAGASHYRGESAVALGTSRISDNGKIILKLNASHNTSGNTMVGAGVGYQF
ncbi:YadA-like family protein [Gallibacterium anatis]|uniref:YadA-like family protein n=1 Tax=Gallibacterium anatis TaxID=750 RepID=UPI0039FBFC2A